MVQIAMLLFAFPLGAAGWSRRAAYAATAALFILVSVPQVLTTPQRSEASYWVVQAITVIVAYALVTWGAAWGAHRRTRRATA